MQKPTTEQLLAFFKAKDFLLVENPYYPNLFGIRTETNTPNRFDDWIGAVYKDKAGKWCSYCYNGTTDPGQYWLEHPMNINGTAIIIPGQYLKVYKIGTHTGYKAYQQCKAMAYVRDTNKNKVLDLLYRIVGHKIYFEIASTNLHHANSNTVSTVDDKWSAGCQVVASPTEYECLLDLGVLFDLQTKVENKYNYALFEEIDITK